MKTIVPFVRYLLLSILAVASLAHADLMRHVVNHIVVVGNQPKVGTVHAFNFAFGVKLKPGESHAHFTDFQFTNGDIVIDNKGDTMPIDRTCKVRVSTGETLEFIGRIDQNGHTTNMYCLHYWEN